MNLTQFLEELSKTRDGWTLDVLNIRKSTRLNEHCPITAVCMRIKKRRFEPGDAEAAGTALGLSLKATHNIIAAADGGQTRLRSRLLKAVGLK